MVRGRSRVCWLIQVCVIGSALVAGCGLGVRARAFVGSTIAVKVQVAALANQNNPVAVDVLFVYDRDLLNTVLQMSANDWFAKREQLARDYPQQSGFAVWSWEWVPGQIVLPQALPLQPKARAGVIFARYRSAGEHRARFDPYNGISLELRETNVQVKPLT
jgi:type VI secretion system protein